MPAAKVRERKAARRLRHEGLPLKQIAARLGVSVSSVHTWTTDIQLGEEQRSRNLRAAAAARGHRWAELNRERRRRYQLAGRVHARKGDVLHQAGCMLYWAEGTKARGGVEFCNADRAMVGFFWRFLTTRFDIDIERARVRLNVYFNNGLSLEEIQRWWNCELDVPSGCFCRHIVNRRPSSSTGARSKRLPFGVCELRYSSTEIVQHIYGAIQEYAGFDEPRWLDGAPRRRALAPRPTACSSSDTELANSAPSSAASGSASGST